MRNPIVVLMGGFGNQMFQFAFALERYPDKPFMLETSLASARLAVNGNLELENYQLPSNVTVADLGATRLSRKLVNVVLRASLSRASLKFKFSLIKTIELFLKIAVWQNFRVLCSSGVGFSKLNHEKSSDNELIIGYFQSSKFFTGKTLNVLMNMEHIPQIDDYEKYEKIANSQKPIVVHVRLGDYELEKGIGLLPDSYYLEALNLATKKYPDSPIWIFSNDISKAKSRFKDFDFKEMFFIEDNWNSTSATFEIMRLGSAYVIANSSFSYWAAMLSKNSNPLIIAPQPWFQGTDSPHEILPDKWKTISTR